MGIFYSVVWYHSRLAQYAKRRYNPIDNQRKEHKLQTDISEDVQ